MTEKLLKYTCDGAKNAVAEAEKAGFVPFEYGKVLRFVTAKLFFILFDFRKRLYFFIVEA